MKEKYTSEDPMEVTTRRLGRLAGATFLAGGLTMGAGGSLMVKETVSAYPQIKPEATADKVLVSAVGGVGGVFTLTGLGIAGIGGFMLRDTGIGYKKRRNR